MYLMSPWRLAAAAGLLCLSSVAPAQTPPAAQGKVVSLNGSVQHTPAQKEIWNPAAVFQPLFVSERVRTLTASRASILFIDETQVKLNAGAVLTVNEVRRGSGAPTTLHLQQGEAWFRTKNPKSGLTIQTPAAAAAIRGTEVNLVVRPGETLMTVIEGSVEFSNPAGSILVNAGEEGTARPGEAPTKRVLLNPANAVQWVLYYPVDAAWRDMPAAVLLAGGDVEGARREIAAALAADPRAIRPLVLLSSIELRQNRVQEAIDAASRALAADPNAVPALIASSEAAQARFDLPAARRYLDRALRQDPRNVHALVNRARIRFGTGDTRGAKMDAEAAAAASPDDAQVRSLRGFIRIGDGDVAGARRDFEAAAARDTEFAEPHLGLGLVHFRENRANEGLLEMLTATLLDPHVSLYQSYLGKAYYQTGRFEEGLSALASAKRLDPRDPTPWLYSSLFLRDQNRQVDALTELRTAVELNDNRAVYRGRMLLDRDLATKNVSLAEVYRQLGFEAWGAYEALNSLETDYTNSSAHIFLADTYLLLPDRTQAVGSELLQYFLHAPVNRNSFNSFAEYTSLLEQPRRQLDATIERATRDRGAFDISHRAGNERFTYVTFASGSLQDGARVDTRDERFQAAFQGKLALGASNDVFVYLNRVTSNYGDSEESYRIFGLETGRPVLARQFRTPDPRISRLFNSFDTQFGFRRNWRPGSSLTASVVRTDFEQSSRSREVGTSLCSGLDVGAAGFTATGEMRSPFEGLDLQVQQTTTLGRHQVIAGHQRLSQDKRSECGETIGLAGVGSFPVTDYKSGTDNSEVTYVRDELTVTKRLHATVGVSYQEMEHADLSEKSLIAASRWSPLVGVSFRITPRMVVRAGSFGNLNTSMVGSRISPPTIGGFIIDRNELDAARRSEYNLSLERSGGRTFVGGRAFYRDTRVPHRMSSSTIIPDVKSSSTGGSAFVNGILTRRLSLFADNQFVVMNAEPFNRTDNLLRAGIKFNHERGYFVRVTASHVFQRFSDTVVTELPKSSFALLDVIATKEIAGKRGSVTLQVTNAFDTAFGLSLDGLSIDRFQPRRQVFLFSRWRLF